MDTRPSEPASRLWLLPLLLTGVAASLLAAFWFALRPNIDNPPVVDNSTAKVVKLSRDDSLKLIELRNQALGNLENHEFANADSVLLEIGRMVPSDPFASRNLAICRQLALDATDRHQFAEKFTELTKQAKESVEQSKSVEPTSYIPVIIAARIAAKLDQPELALSKVREAMHLSPDSVGPAYDLFVLLQSAPGDKQNEEGFNALRQVYQRESQNLFVIKDYLPMLAQRQSPELIDTLAQVQIAIAPFVEMIKTNTRIDLKQTIEAAQAAAKEGKWPLVQRSMTILKNLIVSESARDKRFVMLDSLEYLKFDFAAETLSRLDLPSSEVTPSNPVQFVAAGDLVSWPAATGCADLAVTDFDLDGRPDLVVLQEKQLLSWGRKSNDQSWTLLASSETGGVYSGLLAFDFDDDVDQELKGLLGPDKSGVSLKGESAVGRPCHAADPDAILYGQDGLKLLVNTKEPGSTTRTLVSKPGGVEFDEVRGVIAAAVADLDSDGDLDVVVSTAAGLRLFSNRGNLTFEEITARSQLPPEDGQVSALAIVDWDKDSDIDVLISMAKGFGVLENIRHGQFRFRPLDDFAKLRQATSICVGDFDGNASWDVVAAGPVGVIVILTDRTESGSVAVREIGSLMSTPMRSVRSGDFDNDGDLDLLVHGDDGGSIYRSDANGKFAPMPDTKKDWLKGSTAICVDDLDRDGDLDLIVPDGGKVTCLSSQCCESDNPKNGWLEIQLVGERIRPGEQNWDKRVNHINLGGMLEVQIENKYQPRVVTSSVTHFGLGTNQKADRARILWTNGIPSNILAPSAHESFCIEQKLVGSCPYLYTWNGERFEFVTDLLWNAPLGLKFAETIVAPWREWEYLKIDGRQLKAVDHAYQLRVTAELWEAEYFDQFKLFAIDHPAGTEIFTNEKVGPASLAQPKIHTLHSARKPIAARDTQGRDILTQVLERDGNYTKTFDKRLAQGFTDEHFLELDLGEFTDAKSITLFLTGWMYPGSTSLRVQLSQNPDLPAQRPPSLHTPDANGQWREIRPFMGFPGGKTKTIAVDLSDVFVGQDHRLRIVSTMEIFWDAAFFTVDDPDVEIQQTELTMVRAAVVDRGGVSSRTWPATGNGPDQFDYSCVVPGEQWPAMSGNFTRFGDVLPLLTVRDDQLVVTGSGDEIQLAFAEPAPPPTGWVRDFVIYSVGWDKDADPNTVYGNTVEPLPFEAMTDYAHRDGESRPRDPAYVRYLREYQTRQRNPATFWNMVRPSRQKGIESRNSGESP